MAARNPELVPASDPNSPAHTTVAVSRRAADRLRAGHLWVYRSDLVPSSTAESIPAPASLVTVLDSRGLPLGSALWSSASEIALRLVSRRPHLSSSDYLGELRLRLRTALDLRRELLPDAFSPHDPDPLTNACRLVFSEADALPGIVLDRYAGLLVLQLLTQRTAQPDVRAALRDVLAEQPWVQTVVERSDPRIRELEQLEPAPSEPLFTRREDAEGATNSELQTLFTINGLRFHFDAAAGQKTGAFLDQRANYQAAADWAARLGCTRRALDICTYQGGFALHLARVCQQVTGVDASRAALEVADRNLALNSERNTRLAETDWIEADAFELLRDWQDSGQRFDTIMLDPPAFAKSRRAAEGALRGYKELNLRAMKMLGAARPPMAETFPQPTTNSAGNGLLITCSCSFHVSLSDLIEVLRAAAVDAGRTVQILETRGAAPDHPAIATLPETSYLKCIVCRVS